MDFDSNKPIYLQLADHIMDDVETGYAKGGERILSVREYAADAGVNANTVQRTYTWLQQAGIVTQKRGIGYFYAEDAAEKVREMRREAFFEKEMPYFLERLRLSDITPDKLKTIYSDYLKKIN